MSRRAPNGLALGAALASALVLGGCGGAARQDANEPTGTFAMEVVHASFPTDQSIARQSKLELQVRNTGTRTAPNVAVSVDSFDYASHYPGLADDKRPIWVIERGPGATAEPPVETQEVSVPGGGETAYVNTWALGALAAGQTRTFTWRVMPVKPGSYTVHYTVVAGLAGKAKAALTSGAPVQGQFAVDIAPAPPLTHVNPATLRPEVGEAPATP
ncbi:MAG TPA: hypothetical protein VK778_15100 [Solirubrobacteraceae bacterium]|nr:hypothetical protein [Solirubrobacteraceae bacterium]